jgi:hypothetical protein
LAHCLQMLGDAQAALPLDRRALEGAERKLGSDHPWTRIFRNNLGRASNPPDQSDDAEPAP